MGNKENKNVFISYRRVDNTKSEVTKFHKMLESKSNHTLYAFLDLKDMESGFFNEQIISAIENSYCFVPIVTKNYVKDDNKDENDWCMKELKVAIRSQKIIVPIFVCNASEINEQFGIHTTNEEKRTDFENIDSWEKKDIIKYLTVSNGTNASVKSKTYSLIDENGDTNEECVDYALKFIYKTFCDAKDSHFYYNFLIKEKASLESLHINNTAFRFNMSKYIDLGITGKPTKAEREEAERKQDRQRPLSDFLPNLNHFSVEEFIEKFEKERFAVVTGDAGQGKSIFLKKVCMTLCDNAKKNGLSKDKLFPIYAEIKHFDFGKDLDFYDALSFAVSYNMTKESAILTKELLETIFRNGKPCLLLDGIDEIDPTAFDHFFNIIKTSEIFKNCHILFSSRPGQSLIKKVISYKENMSIGEDIFRVWTVDHISDNNLFGFIKNEIEYNQKENIDEVFCQRFFDELTKKEKEDIKYKDMSRNPFMLKSIVGTCGDKIKLPKSKIEAFDIAVNNLIRREVKQENWNEAKESLNETEKAELPIFIKKLLGYLAYNAYCSNNTSEKPSTNFFEIIINNDDCNEALNEIIDSDNKKKLISAFLGQNTLVDKSGFVHDLFACYYCAFYLYRNIIEYENFIEYKNFIECFLKDINPNADYWRGVIEMLICLFEFNATKTKRPLRKLLETMLVSMQEVVDTPDYELLCGAVSQFIDQKFNKPMSESVLIKGMLKRGERGIISFDKETFECSDGANPYEELFYYVVVYNFVLGLDKIYDEKKDKNDLTPIQTYLYNELCKVLNKEENVLKENPVKKFTKQFTLASSEKRRDRRTAFLKGHVNVDKELNSIKFLAFCGDSGLTSISIPDGVKSIECEAFQYCSALISISLGNGVKSIWDSAFEGCSELTSIEVSKGNKYYHSKGNCLIETKTNTLILGCGNSIIPNYVTEISGSAFEGRSRLTSISIPNSVTSIGDYAFDGCSALTSLSLGNGVKSIGKRAFNYCSMLASIKVSKGNKYYHSNGNCIIETKSNTLILGCKNSVIPDYVTEISGFAFTGCKNLFYNEYDNAFYLGNENNLYHALIKAKNSDITSCKIHERTKIISDDAFDLSIYNKLIVIVQHLNLKNISIPDNVQFIGRHAFSGCSGLTSIEVSKGNKYFHSEGNCLIETKTNTLILGCKNSTIPDYVINIGKSAFSGCSELPSITIPDRVQNIGGFAFFWCKSLKNIYYKGTMEQWQSIEGIESCGINFEECTIHCIDGDIGGTES